MAGAAILSALGALRAGAGLLTVGIVRGERQILTRRLPEAMTLPLPGTTGGWVSSSSFNLIKAYVRRRTITTLAIGPGLTVHPSVHNTVKKLLSLGLPTVLDADGLNNVNPADLKDRSVIVTPHPGELARLLDKSPRVIQKDRSAVAAATAKRLGIICVLKGHQTVISDGQKTFINTTGNPAMATGGMGDVLTGVIAGLLAQGLSLFDAACAGVYIHGLAGDLARVSDRGLLATELAELIPHALRKIGLR